MDNRINYRMVLDTETANTLDQPLVYDVGGIVCDKNGRIYESFSFVIREVFVGLYDVMTSAYYANKMDEYRKDMREGKRKMVNFLDARHAILDLMDKYHIDEVCAYNASFDRNALNTTLRYLTKSKYRYFFPRRAEFTCIWNMACQTICQRPTYKDFCEENFFVSNKHDCDDAKNYSTSAETVYRYLILDPLFEEEHKGLDDVLIENEIMMRVYASHEAMPHGKGIRRTCWMDVKREI